MFKGPSLRIPDGAGTTLTFTGTPVLGLRIGHWRDAMKGITKMLFWLYRIFFLPTLLVMAPAYLWRMRRRGGYGANFAQRFGAHPHLRSAAGKSQRVWLQAVSVGEMLAIGPLLAALKADGVEVYLTTTTSTGYRLAEERYRGLTLGVGYFPIDWWFFSALAWRRIEPHLVILTEGERWPEHLWQAGRRQVPVIAINARLSDRSYARLMFFPPAAKLMFEGITRLLPASAWDETRFRTLGVPAGKLLTTGNIKLDVPIALLSEAARDRLRRELGLGPGLVLLGSSTWPGEEEALLAAWRGIVAAGRRCTLLLVPRHAERRGEIVRLLQDASVRYHLRSTGAAPAEVEVSVGDTTGELSQLTQLADVVFVGKSLSPHTGGQTPVEAAALGKPIIFGPGMGNFRSLAGDLLARGAACEVGDASALVAEAGRLLASSEQRAFMSSAAEKWRADNSGAVDRTMTVIREELAALRG